MSEIDWKNVNSKLSSSPIFMRLYDNQKCLLRLVDKPISFNRIFLKDCSVRTIAIDKNIDICVMSELGKFPILQPSCVSRYAVNVLENNNLKIFEFGKSIFNKFASWTQSDPGGVSGPIWRVSAHGTGINRKYDAIPTDIHLLDKYYLNSDDTIDKSKLHDLDSACKIFHSVESAMIHLGLPAPIEMKENNMECDDSIPHDANIKYKLNRFRGFLDGMEECEI